MRKCHICGEEVDDKTYICPNCGAEIVGDTGGLTLKASAPVKKKSSNSLGTTVSTGSGLTDILRAEDDTSDVLGSIPTTMSYNVIDENFSQKKKSHIVGKIVKVILILAVIAGVGLLVKNLFFNNEEGPKSYQDALDTYIEAINNGDLDKMTFVTPAFFNDRKSEAERKLDELSGVHIDKYEIKDTYTLSATERTKLQDTIKYATNKTANMSDAINIKLDVEGKLGDLVQSGKKSGEFIVQIVCIRDHWYVLLNQYEDVIFEEN